MVTLELKQLRLRNGWLLDYKTQLLEAVRTVSPFDPQGNQKQGFDYEDMKKDSEPLADKIEAANGSLELTAAEVMQLVPKVEKMRWQFSDRAFIQFVEDVRALTTQ